MLIHLRLSLADPSTPHLLKWGGCHSHLPSFDRSFYGIGSFPGLGHPRQQGVLVQGQHQRGVHYHPGHLPSQWYPRQQGPKGFGGAKYFQIGVSLVSELKSAFATFPTSHFLHFPHAHRGYAYIVTRTLQYNICSGTRKTVRAPTWISMEPVVEHPTEVPPTTEYRLNLNKLEQK